MASVVLLIMVIVLTGVKLGMPITKKELVVNNNLTIEVAVTKDKSPVTTPNTIVRRGDMGDDVDNEANDIDEYIRQQKELHLRERRGAPSMSKAEKSNMTISSQIVRYLNLTLEDELRKRLGGKELTPQDLGLFKAYDCSQPTDVWDIGFNHDSSAEEICASAAEEVTQEEKQYMLLQKQEFQHREGYSCQVLRTRLVGHCGEYDHWAVEPRHSILMPEPMNVSISRCSYIKEHGMFPAKGKDGQITNIPVQFGKHNMFKIQEAGTTELTGDGFGVFHGYQNEVSCTGGTWDSRENNPNGDWIAPDGEVLNEVIVTTWYDVILKNESFVSNEYTVNSLADRVSQLPCRAWDHGCSTGDKTYMIEGEYESCYLAYVKKVKGYDVTETGKETVFMSTDNSLIRVIKGKEQFNCGRKMFPTNYDDLYLLPWPEEVIPTGYKKLPLIQQVVTRELSMVTYVHVRDAFLYENTLTLLKEEFEYVVQQECRRRYRDNRLHFWLQLESPGLTTFFINKDIFATASGECLYKYRCTPVFVRAIPSDTCYYGIPVVRVQEPPEDEIDLYRGQQLYMEPLTHRLIAYAIPATCSATFLPKFRNAAGTWVTVHPIVKETVGPTEAHIDAEPLRRIVFRNKVNVSDPAAGIYHLQELREKERQAMMGVMSTALDLTILDQIKETFRGGSYVPQSVMFPMVLPHEKWAAKAWENLTWFVQNFGNIAASMFGLYILTKGIITITFSILSCHTFAGTYGRFTRQILWAFCPTTFLMRKYQKASRRRPDGVTEEELSNNMPLLAEQMRKNNLILKPKPPRPPPPRPPPPGSSNPASEEGPRVSLGELGEALEQIERVDKGLQEVFGAEEDDPVYAAIDAEKKARSQPVLGTDDAGSDLPLPPHPMQLLNLSYPTYPSYPGGVKPGKGGAGSPGSRHRRSQSEGGYRFSVRPQQELTPIAETSSSKENSQTSSGEVTLKKSDSGGSIYPILPDKTVD